MWQGRISSTAQVFRTYLINYKSYRPEISLFPQHVRADRYYWNFEGADTILEEKVETLQGQGADSAPVVVRFLFLNG